VDFPVAEAFRGTTMTSCVERVILRLELAPSSGGISVVQYPFFFRAGG